MSIALLRQCALSIPALYITLGSAGYQRLTFAPSRTVRSSITLFSFSRTYYRILGKQKWSSVYVQILAFLHFRADSDSEDETIEISKKASKPTKRVCGWNSSTNLLCKKPATAADNRSSIAAKPWQRRATLSNNFAADVKVKINLYDRYTANAATECFKFFHYSDLRLYIKQYRRNHSCGLGHRHHMTNGRSISNI